jgi:hypothetical protein
VWEYVHSLARPKREVRSSIIQTLRQYNTFGAFAPCTHTHTHHSHHSHHSHQACSRLHIERSKCNSKSGIAWGWQLSLYLCTINLKSQHIAMMHSIHQNNLKGQHHQCLRSQLCASVQLRTQNCPHSYLLTNARLPETQTSCDTYVNIWKRVRNGACMH